jgi:hypothetical protein
LLYETLYFSRHESVRLFTILERHDGDRYLGREQTSDRSDSLLAS